MKDFSPIGAIFGPVGAIGGIFFFEKTSRRSPVGAIFPALRAMMGRQFLRIMRTIAVRAVRSLGPTGLARLNL